MAARRKKATRRKAKRSKRGNTKRRKVTRKATRRASKGKCECKPGMALGSLTKVPLKVLVTRRNQLDSAIKKRATRVGVSRRHKSSTAFDVSEVY